MAFQLSHSQSLTAMQAYDEVTKYRDSAFELWHKDHPTKQDFDQSIIILNRGLQYLDQPEIWDLAQGDTYLKYRRYNILMDLVRIYNLSGNADTALALLQQMSDMGSYSLNFATQDSSLINLRSDKRYIEMMNAENARQSLWQSTAFKTPYRQDLPLNEKIAGLSLLWSQAKYNFVHFDHAGIDWNKLYMDYLNEIPKTTSTADYYKLLIKFYASLKDAHTNVYYPKEIQKDFYSRPPFRTALIEGKVFVTDVFSDSLKSIGITPGIEIVSIEGKPVLDYAKQEVEPYQSSSTLQDLEVRMYTYALLAGKEGQPIKLGLKDKKGNVQTKIISRTGYHDVKSTPVFQYQEINKVGYLTINGFEDQHIKKQFDSLCALISDTKGLIIDLRKNGGGSGDIGFHILSCLTDKPFKISRSKITQYNSTMGGDAQWYSYPQEEINPNKKIYYSKPVVVLISARTFSAAEDFVVAFKFMNRGKLIGQTTGGSTGQPLLFDLPGGGTARVCAKDDIYPNGEKFVGIGIPPDIYVKKTIKDLFENKDAELQKAIELITNSGSKSF